MLRALEIIFSIYFFTHIPITLLIDSQAIFPRSYYPSQILDLTEWYVKELKDTYFKSPPIWYRSFVWCEIFLQLPFFFVATYAFIKGSCTWIRVPALVYSAHVATTVLPIMASLWFEDFSTKIPVGPITDKEKLTLLAIYCPYLIIPLVILATMLCSKTYSGMPPVRPQAKNKKCK